MRRCPGGTGSNMPFESFEWHAGGIRPTAGCQDGADVRAENGDLGRRASRVTRSPDCDDASWGFAIEIPELCHQRADYRLAEFERNCVTKLALYVGART